MYKISLHQGTANESSLGHNQRKFIAHNVDENRIKDNVIIRDESLEEAYKKCFSEALEKYNKKQTRKDRKQTVKSYLEKIQKSANKKNTRKTYYEWIVQIGNRENAGIKENPAGAETCKKILQEYVKDLEARTKNHMYIFGAYIHMDETTPHLHIDFIPMAHFERGLTVRNGLEKAVEQLGYSLDNSKKTKRTNNRAFWQDAERDELVKLAAKYGLQAYWERHEVAEKHLTMNEYRAAGKLADEQTRAAAEKAQAEAEEKAAEYIKNRSLSGIVARFKDNSDIVREVVKNAAAGQILQREALSKQKALLTDREAKLNARQRSLDTREDELDAREHTLSEKEQQQAAAQEKIKREQEEQQQQKKQLTELSYKLQLSQMRQERRDKEIKQQQNYIKRYEQDNQDFMTWRDHVAAADKREAAAETVEREADKKVAAAQAHEAAVLKAAADREAAAKQREEIAAEREAAARKAEKEAEEMKHREYLQKTSSLRKNKSRI